MNNVRALVLVVMVLGVVLLPSIVGAQTPTTEWVNFYSSNTTLDGQPVPVGAVVTASDPSGVLCGQFVVTDAGSYGFLACYIDDPNTPQDEGIVAGDVVRFRINGATAGQFQLPATIQNGDRFEVNLAVTTAPPPTHPQPPPTPKPQPPAPTATAVPSSPPEPIPEPATIILLGGGAAMLGAYLRRRGREGEEE